MSDDDPIRRGDAKAAMARYHWERYSSRAEGGKLSSPAVFTSHTWQDVQDIIAALPVAQVGVKPDRETFDAMCAMRDSINEYIPMPSLESDLLKGPENSVFCATVAEAVIQEVKRLRALVVQPSPDVAALVAALVEHNDLLRSAFQIARREGVNGEVASTNWDAYYNGVAVSLKRHHETTNKARAALARVKGGA